MDDIIVTDTDSTLLDSVIAKLQITFAMKNLGQSLYFLGIEAHVHQGSLFSSQSKYIVDLFKRASMLDAKPIDSPIAPKMPLPSLHDEHLDDATQYRRIVGAVRYVSITMLDISFPVN